MPFWTLRCLQVQGMATGMNTRGLAGGWAGDWLGLQLYEQWGALLGPKKWREQPERRALLNECSHSDEADWSPWESVGSFVVVAVIVLVAVVVGCCCFFPSPLSSLSSSSLPRPLLLLLLLLRALRSASRDRPNYRQTALRSPLQPSSWG